MVAGPYGLGLKRAQPYRHILSIGSRTGIIPMLSLLESTCLKLSQVRGGRPPVPPPLAPPPPLRTRPGPGRTAPLPG